MDLVANDISMGIINATCYDNVFISLFAFSITYLHRSFVSNKINGNKLPTLVIYLILKISLVTDCEGLNWISGFTKCVNILDINVQELTESTINCTKKYVTGWDDKKYENYNGVCKILKELLKENYKLCKVLNKLLNNPFLKSFIKDRSEKSLEDFFNKLSSEDRFGGSGVCSAVYSEIETLMDLIINQVDWYETNLYFSNCNWNSINISNSSDTTVHGLFFKICDNITIFLNEYQNYLDIKQKAYDESIRIKGPKDAKCVDKCRSKTSYQILDKSSGITTSYILEDPRQTTMVQYEPKSSICSQEPCYEPMVWKPICENICNEPCNDNIYVKPCVKPCEIPPCKKKKRCKKKKQRCIEKSCHDRSCKERPCKEKPCKEKPCKRRKKCIKSTVKINKTLMFPL